MNRILLILLLGATAFTAAAQKPNGAAAEPFGKASAAGTELSQPTESPTRQTAPSLRQRLVRRHEIRLSGGILPFKSGMGTYWSLVKVPSTGSTLDRYNDATLNFGWQSYITGAFSLEYNYRIDRRWDIGGALTYLGAYKHVYSNRDGSTLGRVFRHYITLMPEARYSWYESRLIRLYSAAAVGISFVTGYKNDIRRDVIFAFQVSPIGVEVGGSLFGFAEGGIGAQGALRIGLGYKFNGKR